jgi:hypothetical protein
MKHVHDTFGDIPSFISREDLPPTKVKIQEIFSDAPNCRKLQIELAITIDAGEKFVKSTYRLEGDGALVFSAYDEISKLRAAISTR